MKRAAPGMVGANSPASMNVSCLAANHTYDYERLIALKPRMQKLAFNEKQPASSVAQQVWIHPEAQSALHQRWPGNFMTTVYSIFNSLADGETFLVEGEYARELAAAGITKGREVAGMLATINQLRAQVATLEERLKGRPQQSSGGSASDALVAALVEKLGLKVELPATPIFTVESMESAERDPDDVDYREGDEDWAAQPSQPERAAQMRGIPVPVPGGR